MASFVGTIEDTGILIFKNPYLSIDVGILNTGVLQLTVNEPLALDAPPLTAQGIVFVDTKVISNNEWAGFKDERSTLAADWFESFHVTPKVFTFGNVLTTQLEDTEVFSAFRKASHDWQTYVNNAGDGITLVGKPSLPITMGPLVGIQMQLRIDVIGEPSVDSTLDFGFDVQDIHVPITLDRIVLYTPPPEMPYDEDLEFLTDIIPKKDGEEQRISPRKNPRNFFIWNHVLEDGPERQRYHNILYEWQSRTYGIPVWHDMIRLSVDTAAGSGSINVTNTQHTDFREGELIVIYKDDTTFDVLTADTIGPTTITLGNVTVNQYDKGTIVAPLRIAVIEKEVTGGRYPTMHNTTSIKFRVKDNDVDLADVSAFGSYDGKVLLDDPNGLVGQMEEKFIQDIVTIDNKIGVTYENSPWIHNKRISNKTFVAANREGQWNVRRLLYALRGRQISFYLPSYSMDLTLDTNITSGQAIMNIVNTHYNQFVAQRSGRNIMRINFIDGSTPVIKEIIASSVVSDTREALTMDSSFVNPILMTEIKHIDFIDLVRFVSDKITFKHLKGERMVKISSPVISVFD